MDVTAAEAGSAEERYARLAAKLEGAADHPASSLVARRGFGSTALKAGGKIFAMLAHGRLVVKLPAARVNAMAAAGEGTPYVGSGGRTMKEWVALESASPRDWLRAAREALAFVSTRETTPPKRMTP